MSPFSYTGLDYIGPLYVKTSAEPRKVWICIFTCLTVRAVHLELVEDMTADSFLMCFRRFLARRGTPVEILSDNALQFKASKEVVDRILQSVLRDPTVKDYSAKRRINWKFTAELSPWMGGVYERLVGLVKRALRKSLGRICLTFNQLNKVLSEVESLLNSRPIVQVEDDPSQIKALSPSDFLCLNPTQGVRSIDKEDLNDKDYKIRQSSADTLLKTWKKGNKHLDVFWKAWRDEYLIGLRQRPIMPIKQGKRLLEKTPQINQVVLVREEMLPRGTWRLARISELIYSSDGQVRAIKIALSNGKILLRSLLSLYPLEVPADTTIQETPATKDINLRATATTGTNPRPQRKAAQKALEKIVAIRDHGTLDDES